MWGTLMFLMELSSCRLELRKYRVVASWVLILRRVFRMMLCFMHCVFLGVKDLLSVERVCKSFRNAVRSDPLLWRNIIIDWPLNERIFDYVLVKLTSRAQGTLQTLGLVHCVRITDSGLQGVFDSNPRLTKLSVPG